MLDILSLLCFDLSHTSGLFVVFGVHLSAMGDLTEFPWKCSKLMGVLLHKRAKIEQIVLRPLEM